MREIGRRERCDGVSGGRRYMVRVEYTRAVCVGEDGRVEGRIEEGRKQVGSAGRGFMFVFREGGCRAKNPDNVPFLV